MRYITALILSLSASALPAEVAFDTPPYFPLAGGSRAIAGADLDGDGLRDVIVPGSWDDGASPGLFVFRNGREGPLWIAPTRWPSAGGLPTQTHAVADVNRDGIEDIVFITGGTPASAKMYYTVFLGRHSWIEVDSKAYELPENLSAFPLRLADVTGDGIPDVLALLTQHVYVRAGLVGGGLAPQATLSFVPTRSTNSAPNDFTVGDFNADGAADVAVLNADAPGSQVTGIGHDVTIVLGGGTGGFGFYANFDVPRFPLSIGTVDTIEFGPDLLVTTHNVFNPGAADNVFVWAPRSAAQIENVSRHAAGAIPRIVQIVDLDGDGRQEIWLRESNIAFPLMYIVPAAGRERFNPPVIVPTFVRNGAVAGVAHDINGDALPELLVLGNSGTSVDLVVFVNRSRRAAPLRRRSVGR